MSREKIAGRLTTQPEHCALLGNGTFRLSKDWLRLRYRGGRAYALPLRKESSHVGFTRYSNINLYSFFCQSNLHLFYFPFPPFFFLHFLAIFRSFLADLYLPMGRSFSGGICPVFSGILAVPCFRFRIGR